MAVSPRWLDVGLDDLLDGVFCVLAFRERRHVPLHPGAFEAALIGTLRVVAKQAAREKLHLDVHVMPDSLGRPTSLLRKSLRRLERERILRIHQTPSPFAELLLSADAAYGRLAASKVPIGFLERAAKVLHHRLHVARIQHSLAGLARRRPADLP